MTPRRPQTMPAVYIINATTMTPEWVFQAHGNTNCIAFAEDGTLYVDSTGISSGQPNVKDSLKSVHSMPMIRAVADHNSGMSDCFLVASRITATV
jgi:hypothetical protein